MRALIIIIFPIMAIIIAVMNLWNLVSVKRHKIFEVFMFAFGILCMIILYGLWDPKNYQVGLATFNNNGMIHEPVNRTHALSLMIPGVIGIFAYLKMKFARREQAPLMSAFLMSGIYIGLLVNIVFLIQLISGFGFVGIAYGENPTQIYKYGIEAEDWICILFLMLLPIQYCALSIQFIYRFTKKKRQEQEEKVYKNRFLHICNQWLLKSSHLQLGALLLVIPILGVISLILLVFGQQPDSAIKAFTETSDWILSNQAAPPTVIGGDSHYLCTVSLRGHEKLVKPIRYGIRRNEKIVVNRQLCVANAFEQLISEKVPVFHKGIRQFYDKYGYPISRHINKAWTADIIYLLMKPLEYFFVIILYLFDIKPEDRIASQYLPKI